MKTEVYSWRLSSELKSDLERVARSRKVRVSTVLDTAVREWLAKNAVDIASDEEQKRLHAVASRYFGAFASGNANRSEQVRETVGKRLGAKYGR